MAHRPLPTWEVVIRNGWEKELTPVRRDYVKQGFCRWCGNRIKSGRRSMFCGDKCAKKYDNKTVFQSGYGAYKRRVLIRDDFTCRDCGKFMAYENEYGVMVPAGNGRIDVHHIVPISEGGGDEPSNLVTLCAECHKERHRKMREEKRLRGK